MCVYGRLNFENYLLYCLGQLVRELMILGMPERAALASEQIFVVLRIRVGKDNPCLFIVDRRLDGNKCERG